VKFPGVAVVERLAVKIKAVNTGSTGQGKARKDFEFMLRSDWHSKVVVFEFKQRFIHSEDSQQ